MLPTAIIVFREVLEAALVIGIVMAATKGVAGRGWFVGGGILAGVAGAVLVAAFAMLREWRALAVWFALGTIVCFADATIAATSTGRLPQVAFHASCGVACIALAAASWRLWRRSG